MRSRFKTANVFAASILAIFAARAPAQAQGLATPATSTLVNSIGMRFVLLPAGEVRIAEFAPPAAKAPQQTGGSANPTLQSGRPAYEGKPYLLGGPVPTAKELAKEEQGAAAARRPGFVVKIPSPVYMGVYEVTQAQWKQVMGSNPSLFKDKPNSDNRPVDSVTWEQAQAFVQKLNALEKTTAYRLPTEFEWEYAARAGAPANRFDPPFFDQAVGGWQQNWETKPVGSLKPNRWGLYDMAGNVWEWVNDAYNYKHLADPKPPVKGSLHVIKGGGFLSAGMNSIPLTHAAGPANVFDVGFRLAHETDKAR